MEDSRKRERLSEREKDRESSKWAAHSSASGKIGVKSREHTQWVENVMNVYHLLGKIVRVCVRVCAVSALDTNLTAAVEKCKKRTERACWK